MVALIVVILIDTSIVTVYDLVDKNYLPTGDKLTLFAINSMLCIFLQLVLIRHIRHSLDNVRPITRLSSKIFNVIPFFAVGATGAIIALLSTQQFYYGYYNKYLSIALVSVSYAASSALVIRLSMLFLSWYKSERSMVIFLYFVSMALIAFSLIMTAIVTDFKIGERPTEIAEFVGGSANIYVGRYELLDRIYTVSSVISFISIWTTTAILMKYYRDNLKNAIAYWTIVSIPLGYFLINYIYSSILAGALVPYLTLDPIGFSILITALLSLSKPIGGLTFGVAFWRISRSVGYEKNIRSFMVISGWGIFLLFGANQATSQILYPYPPFGLATLTVLILAAYLTLIGIYNSAMLVSLNSDLRRTIHKHALESKLLGLIGRAEMENEVQKTVTEIVKDREVSGLESEISVELNEVELKKYLELVARELRKEKSEKI